MQRIILKSKLHMARVNKKVLDYEGSIEIDEELMELADLVEGEKVLVANVDNGERFETYVIKGKRGSRIIGLKCGNVDVLDDTGRCLRNHRGHNTFLFHSLVRNRGFYQCTYESFHEICYFASSSICSCFRRFGHFHQTTR